MSIPAKNACTRVILVFAKAPVAGEVKTRLIPALGAEGAQRLHRCLLLSQLASAANTGIPSIQLWCAPDTEHPFFETCRKRFDLTLHTQRGEDLGERQQHALESALATYAQVVLIGSDIPSLNSHDIRRAFTVLDEGADAVITPTEDGGYGLIGLRRIAAGLFRGIDWGSSQAGSQLVGNLGRLRWRIQRLEMCWDVDRPEDLTRLRHEIPDGFSPDCLALLADPEYNGQGIEYEDDSA